MKKTSTQKFADILARICIADTEYHNYTDEDLRNATTIFSHFLFDHIFSNCQHLPFEEQIELSSKSGEDLHKFIKQATGKDMHKIPDTI